MFIAFLVIVEVVIVLVMIAAPFVAREGYRTDTTILPEYRRSYYVLSTIGAEAFLAWLGIWGVLYFAAPPGLFSLPPALRSGLTIADIALLGAGILSLVVPFIALLRSIRKRRQV